MREYNILQQINIFVSFIINKEKHIFQRSNHTTQQEYFALANIHYFSDWFYNLNPWNSFFKLLLPTSSQNYFIYPQP